MNPMIPIYAALVGKGVKTLEQVPAKLRNEVEQYMKEANHAETDS